ncbi:group I intron-associated PD-(D/E)XK endonuclease [beta proteobacterium MWH-UniP1]
MRIQHNPKHVGEVTQAIILAELLKRGIAVSIPFGDNQRYDLIIELATGFQRVQCKTGRLKKGAIEFAVASSRYHRGGRRVSYVNQIELFAVYCPANGKCYLVPAASLALKNQCSLRIEPAGNGQSKGIRWAIDFELV